MDVNFVVLHVTVGDHSGKDISRLPEETFRVYEDGVLQEVKLFRCEDSPVAVGLVLDNTGSMRRELPDLVAAATSFAHSRITSNPTRLHSAMLRIQAQGQTVLYDALFAGLDHLADSSLSRKVLIVVSDGGDNANQHKLPVLLEAMKRSDAAVYSVGLFDEYDRDRNPRVLKQLARLSGGVAYFPKEGSDAATVLQAISQDIRNQYTIGYVSTGERRDKAYHAIRVTVVAPQSARWTDRTRPGYFAKPVNNPQ